MRTHTDRSHLLHLCSALLFVCMVGLCHASDVLRSVAMGDIITPLKAPTGGVQINPAALVHAQQNHLVLDLSLAGWQYQDLETTEDVRFLNDLAGDIEPGVYFARGFDTFGLSVGYRAEYDNHVQVSLLNTESTYFVNEQRFEAQTDLVVFYDSLWEKEWFASAGYRLDAANVGARIKWVEQTAKRGELIPSLFLHAQLEDVNPNKADEVIPAIMDGLDYDEDLLQHPMDQVERDRTVGAWDLDIGVQSDWAAERFDVPGLSVGALLENVLQRRRVTTAPMHFAVGANYDANEWFTAATEIGKRFGEAGLEFHLGWEAHVHWTQHAVGGLALRNGWSRRDGHSHISLGLALELGSARWEYALSTQTQGQPLSESRHLIASTIQF